MQSARQTLQFARIRDLAAHETQLPVYQPLHNDKWIIELIISSKNWKKTNPLDVALIMKLLRHKILKMRKFSIWFRTNYWTQWNEYVYIKKIPKGSQNYFDDFSVARFQ